MDKPPVDPQVWSPPPDPGLVGPFERNQRLLHAELWPVPGTGPEDVVVTTDGRVYTGLEDGSILEISEGGDQVRRVARTGGRPLGLELLADGRLLVCDADEGLLAVTPTSGEIEPLVTEVDGQRLRCTNNADVSDDGTIYFTDSSRRFPVHHYEGDLVEHSGTGRLFRRDPDGTVTTLLDGLHFANGVALDPEGEFVLVAETGLYRIIRLWLRGDKEGRSDVFAELPGFPDNLSTGPTGTVWCAVASNRNKILDFLSDKPPALRKLLWSLPEALLPKPANMALVFGFDREGRVTHNLQAHGGDFRVATGAREHDGWLYIGSLYTTDIARYRLE